MKKLLYKYKSLGLTVRGALWFTICSFVLKGISLITVPLFASYLSTEEYGITSIFYSYQQIFLIFSTFELALGAYQRGLLKYKSEQKLFTSSIQYLWSIITIIFFLIVISMRDIFISLTDTNTLILILMFIYFLVQPAYECWITRKRFIYKYQPVVTVTILYALITTFGTLLAVIFIKQTAIVRISSMLVLQILFCAIFYLKNSSVSMILRNRSRVLQHWKFALHFQLPLVFHSLSYLVLSQADRIMIGEMVGKSEAALYSVAYSLANIIIIFQTSVNQVLKPWRYQKMEEKDYKSISNITNIMLVIIGILTLSFVLIAPEVMKVLFNKDYYEAVWTIPPIALSIYFMFLYSVFTDVESYFSKTKYIMYASIVCAIVNIILNYIGINIWGYIACGYTTLISYILFAIMHYIFMRKICIDENIKESIFNVKLIIMLSVFFIIAMLLFVFLYQYSYIRFFILFIILVSVILNRNYLIRIFKNIG